jgi:hypothetical protein
LGYSHSEHTGDPIACGYGFHYDLIYQAGDVVGAGFVGGSVTINAVAFGDGYVNYNCKFELKTLYIDLKDDIKAIMATIKKVPMLLGKDPLNNIRLVIHARFKSVDIDLLD